MGRISVRAAVLVALLCVSVASAGPLRRRRGQTAIKVDSVEPTLVHAGEKIVVRGQGLDLVTAALIGKFSPRILEKSPKRIVLETPKDPNSTLSHYGGFLFLMIPGQPLLVTQVEINVTTETRSAVRLPGPGLAIEEDGTLGAGKAKSWDVALEGAPALEVTIAASGGEVEAKVEAKGGVAEPLARATYAGGLSWLVHASELGSPAVLTVTLSTDVASVRYHTRLTRLGGSLARTPPPPRPVN
jgi:hypothetical protein